MALGTRIRVATVSGKEWAAVWGGSHTFISTVCETRLLWSNHLFVGQTKLRAPSVEAERWLDGTIRILAPRTVHIKHPLLLVRRTEQSTGALESAGRPSLALGMLARAVLRLLLTGGLALVFRAVSGAVSAVLQCH